MTGIASGNAVFSLHDAQILHTSGLSAILILDTCCLPGESVAIGEDALLVAFGEGGLSNLAGLLVLQGGVTSPLVELTRSRGIPVISGASKSGLFLDNYSTRACPYIRRKLANRFRTSSVTNTSPSMENHPFSNTEVVIRQYQKITLDGSSGRIFQGALPTVCLGFDFCDLLCMRWVDDARRLR